MAGEINIDKKLLRKALEILEIGKAFPLYINRSGASTITYDGEYIIINNAVGEYSAVGTGWSSPQYAANRPGYYLYAQATMHAVTDDTNCYFLFMEPKKGQYDWYQGFRTDVGAGSHCFKFRNAGAEESDAIAGQDWTIDHEFKICHIKGVVEENSGITGAIASGTAVSHGLLGTPTSVTVTAAETGPTDIWVDTVGAATFKINFGGGGNKTFYWIAKYAAASECLGYIDGVLKASSNDDTKISKQPFAILCCEPNAQARVMKVKYPPGIHFSMV